MTDETARREVAEYWMDRTDSALASAASEPAARRYDFAANRAYYACFYAASAVLLAAGRKFTKHSGVRGAVHQDLVKPANLKGPGSFGPASRPAWVYPDRQAGGYHVRRSLISALNLASQ